MFAFHLVQSDNTEFLLMKTQRGLKSNSQLTKKLCYLFQRKPFKNDGKWFLFYLKNAFCSQDI